MAQIINDTAKLAFIGTGNMGGAMARAARRKIPAARVLLANRTREKAEALASVLGGCGVISNVQAAETADFLFLGVKPQMLADLLAEIGPTLTRRQNRFILVSMAAGWTIARIQEALGFQCPIIRIMPNTPSSIGEGMILYTCSPEVSEQKAQVFLDAMAGAGRFSAIPEHLIDAGSAVCGCGPAFADLFLEALADGGVACGLPRAQALEFAAQMLVGAGRLALESGQHPGALKDAVCSPGGTTIQGVRALENGGFRGAVMEAVIAAYEKTLALK